MGEIMYKLKLTSLLLALSLSLMPLPVLAASLGKLSVASGLGEPFKAEVELLSVSTDELASLVATMASEEAYLAQGITRLGIHSNIKVEIAQNPNGTPFLKLHSSEPVSDPFLDLLIQLDWASGRLLREYTILLDPPGMKVTADEEPVLPNSLPSVELGNKSVSSKGLSVKRKTKQAPTELSPDAASAIEAPNYKVKYGDNLNTIAKSLQVDGVSLDQMLVGLFDINEQAFIHGNMNRLQVGKIIKVPNKDSLVAIDEGQAKEFIKVQTESWKAYRNSLANKVASASTELEEDQKQSVSGQITAPTDKTLLPKSGARDVVKLSAGLKDNGNPSKAMEAKLTMLQEENTAQAKSLKEAQERTANLEKQIADMRKLLTLNSQAMAVLQKNATEPVTGIDVQSKSFSTSPSVDGQVPANSATSKDQGIKPVIPAKNAKSPVNLIAEMAGIIRGASDLGVFAVAAVVAFLLSILLFMRNKRKKILGGFESRDKNSGGLDSDQVFGNSANYLNEADTSSVTEFTTSNSAKLLGSQEADPIAEAEIYLAFGRYEEAETTLKNAISKSPYDYELHLKLLELYIANKNMVAFESLAEKLYAELGVENPIWTKVAKIGSAIDPTNPLYDPATVSKKKSNTTNLNVVKEVLSASEKVGDKFTDVSIGNVKENSGHFDQAESNLPVRVVSNNPIERISLDTGLDSANQSKAKPMHLDPVVVKDEGIQKTGKAFDFSAISFNLDEGDTNSVVAKPAFDVASLLASIANDPNSVELKIELAEAYINMGDKERAVEILDDVKKTGNNKHKLLAKKLLANLL